MKVVRVALVLVCFGLPLVFNPAVVAQQATADTVSQHVFDQEKLAWELVKKKDKAGLDKVLSDDFTEINDDGVFDKAQIMAYLDDLTLSSYSPTGFKAKKLAPDAMLVMYQIKASGQYKGTDFQTTHNAASLWMKRGGKWQNVHYQQTPVPK